jgi:hypothetical protein
MAKKKKKKSILSNILDGIIPALPFGNFFEQLRKNIQEDTYNDKGQVNYPKLFVYILTALIVFLRLIGFISNEDILIITQSISQVVT